jgi:RHS repeat-associated protein
MYSPLIGRFVQRDPIGYGAAHENIYVYAGNRPLDIVDPLGTWDWPWNWPWPQIIPIFP